MSKIPAFRQISKGAKPELDLTPGCLYGARVELAVVGRFQVRLLTGETLLATPGPGVDPRLILQALSNSSLVLVTRTDQGIEVLGALQTQLTPTISADDELKLHARRVSITADEDVRLGSGSASINLTERGSTEINGDRLTINAHARVRVLSALVELP